MIESETEGKVSDMWKEPNIKDCNIEVGTIVTDRATTLKVIFFFNVIMTSGVEFDDVDSFGNHSSTFKLEFMNVDFVYEHKTVHTSELPGNQILIKNKKLIQGDLEVLLTNELVHGSVFDEFMQKGDTSEKKYNQFFSGFKINIYSSC